MLETRTFGYTLTTMSFFGKAEVDDSYLTILLYNIPGSNVVMTYSKRMNPGHMLHDACPEEGKVVSYNITLDPYHTHGLPLSPCQVSKRF